MSASDPGRAGAGRRRSRLNWQENHRSSAFPVVGSPQSVLHRAAQLRLLARVAELLAGLPVKPPLIPLIGARLRPRGSFDGRRRGLLVGSGRRGSRHRRLGDRGGGGGHLRCGVARRHGESGHRQQITRGFISALVLNAEGSVPVSRRAGCRIGVRHEGDVDEALPGRDVGIIRAPKPVQCLIGAVDLASDLQPHIGADACEVIPQNLKSEQLKYLVYLPG